MTLKDTCVLVTGAAGFIGSRLTAQLVERGASVAVQIMPGERTDTLAPVYDKVTQYTADLRDADAVGLMVTQAAPEVVLHLAATGVSNPFLALEDALSINLYGTLNLLRALSTGHATPGMARVVIARTVGEKSNLNPYAASKSAAWAIAEMLHRTEGIPILGLMLYQVYGAGQSARALIPSAIRAALRGEDFAMTHGRQVRDWVYVDDVVQAFIAAATAPDVAGHTFEVGSGHGTSLRDVVTLAWQLSGAKGKVRVGALPARPGEIAVQIADPLATEKALGWQARVSLEEGLRRMIAEDKADI